MKLIKATNYQEMSCKAAQIIAATIVLKPDCVLGLATGSTPIGLYEELVRLYQENVLDFSAVHTVNLDEYRGINATNDQSYAYFMKHHLFQHINIAAENTNVPNGQEPDADKECLRYDEIIKELDGIDLQLLGIGHNGHIGFNEPAADFPKGTHCVDLEESTIEANARFFADANQVPRQAYTMGIKTIMQAKKILLVANGKNKAEILHQAFYGPITPQVPASILQLHPDVVVVADQAALTAFAK
jgi:glucosamine-6-phosphate deaminase